MRNMYEDLVSQQYLAYHKAEDVLQYSTSRVIQIN